MNSNDRHRSMAHLWLYAAGVDDAAVDAHGASLSESLAKVLNQVERDARRVAARQFMDTRRSGEHRFTDETGRYDVGELERLLAATGTDF